MTPATILRDLQALGITLRAQGDKLRFHPRDAMTPELLAGIRDHKQDLLRLLTEPTPAPGCGSPGGDDHDTQALGCVGSTDAGPDETACHEQQQPAGPDLTGWREYLTADGGEGIEAPGAGPPRTLNPPRTAKRLVGDDFPARPTPDVDPRILATPAVLCPRCGAARVLPELREMTGGTCWTCHTQATTTSTPAPKRRGPPEGVRQIAVRPKKRKGPEPRATTPTDARPTGWTCPTCGGRDIDQDADGWFCIACKEPAT